MVGQWESKVRLRVGRSEQKMKAGLMAVMMAAPTDWLMDGLKVGQLAGLKERQCLPNNMA